jgi:1,2-diacylglycerol 3-alpha-glucosyltransferase
VRIAVVSDSVPPTPSGVAIGVALLADGLSARGHDVVRIGPSWPGVPGRRRSAAGPERAATGPSLVALPSVPVRPSIGLRLAPATAGGLLRRLRDHDVELVHVHTEGPLGWAARGAARRLDLPLVATVHTFYDHYLHYLAVPSALRPQAAGAVRAGWRRFLRAADHVVAPSPSAAALARALVPGTPVSLVPNPAPAPAPSATAGSRTPMLLSVGRVAPEKRARELVLALAAALAERPDVRAMVVGGGPDLRPLRRHVARRGLDDRLVLPGPLPHAAVLRLYRRAAVYLSAARSENHPLTLLEAAAAGLPLVVAQEPGLLATGLAGVAETAADEGELVATALALLDDDRRRRELARASRGYADRHDLPAHLAGLEAVYHAVRAGVALT